MKHTKRSINKATERYSLFIHGIMDAVLLGYTIYSENYGSYSNKKICGIYAVGHDPSTYKRLWSIGSGTPGWGEPIDPSAAREIVRAHFISVGMPVETLDRLEHRD